MSTSTSDTRVHGYRLGERLGAGAMGAVYAARREADGHPVAIKIIHPEHVYNPRLVTRFLSEARAITRIDHENVIKVYECAEAAAGQCVIVMELVDGESLRSLLDRDGSIPLSRAIGIAAKIALGVAAAHDKGIVHRDLKPDNVMLGASISGSRDDEQVKVLDFGVAKIAGEVNHRLTMTGTIIGTPDYMAPELIGDPTQASPTADIYALGCMLFEMCAGTTPFSARGYEVLVRQLHDAPPSPRALNPEIPSWLEQIILGAMSKDPAQRFQSMTEMATALLRANRQRGSIVSTRPGRPVPAVAVPPRRPLEELEAIYSARTNTSTQPGHAPLGELATPSPSPLADTDTATDLHSAPTRLHVLPSPAFAPTRPQAAADWTESVVPLAAWRRERVARATVQRAAWIAATIVAVVLGSMGVGRALRRTTAQRSFTVDTQPLLCGDPDLFRKCRRHAGRLH